MITLVDLGISNLASVVRALERVGAPFVQCRGSGDLDDAAAILLPGVGAFGDGMASLREKALVAPLRRAAAAGTPIFGICLGMQLLAEESEEHGRHQGLGLIRGRVLRLAPREAHGRVPNIGWCDVTPTRRGVLFPDGQGGCFYHVHSFRLDPADSACIAATIAYSGEAIPVAIEQENLFGVQFHAEKSQDAGLDLLAAFLAHLRAAGRIG
ncbi:MAG: imidazole glycerol phosphate synthase subunit HisH [Alphaproteobacteria bacterium]|nr:imidazole glycerol phosphate synthase subunit HisH [Alphaproteobacteria bacterium]